jgi:phage shock protein A
LQVEEAVRARLSLEKEASLLRASNDNYAQQVDALTAQVTKLEASIAEATEQNNLATTQLQQVRRVFFF